MIKILLSGANGRMGQAITRLVADSAQAEIVCGVDLNTESKGGFPVYADFAAVQEQPDVVVDFSNPANFQNLMDYVLQHKIPVVVATTGLNKEQKEQLCAASATVPVFFSANMSLGVNLICELAKKAARFLGDSFDIEIVERHHNQKLDAPSGTALMPMPLTKSWITQRIMCTTDTASAKSVRKTKSASMLSAAVPSWVTIR